MCKKTYQSTDHIANKYCLAMLLILNCVSFIF